MPRWLAFVVVLMLAGLTACQNEYRWYEQRCQRIGLQPGTSEFDACVEREVQWLEQERQQRERNLGR